jgi:CRISPR/Cas system-associated exonuclease Cas4 (RecB family)
MLPYERQLLIYAYGIEEFMALDIDEIRISFVRLGGREHVVERTEEKTKAALDWFTSTIDKIMETDEFEPNVNKYFCSNICAFREICEYWKEEK